LEALSLEDLMTQLPLDQMSVSPAISDSVRLESLNKQHLRERSLSELIALTEPYLQEAFGAISCHDGTVFSETAWRETFTQAVGEEMIKLGDVVSLGRPIFRDRFDLTPEAREAVEQPFTREVLAALAGDLPGVEPFDYETLNNYLRGLRARFKAERGLAGRQVMFSIRAALTGTLKGPCLVVVMILLGRDRCLSRIRSITS
jgi:nondiscriminating glutamyl-tRNA synthetase